MERLPGEWGAQRRVERQELEQDRRARAWRPDDEQRRLDGSRRDRRLSGPEVDEAEPGAQDAQDLATGDEPAHGVEPGLGVDGADLPPVRLLPARPLGLTEVVEPGRRTSDRQQLFGIEHDEVLRAAGDVAEQVHAAQPVGVTQLLRHRLSSSLAVVAVEWQV